MPQFSRSAVLTWDGNILDGHGTVAARTGAFSAKARFPSMAGEPAGTTTPEELLAASHAVCYGIGLRSQIARRGGAAERVSVTATITAEKNSQGIRIISSHLDGVVVALSGLDDAALQEIAAATAKDCTISNALRQDVAITYSVTAS